MSLTISSLRGLRDLYPDDMSLRSYIFNGWRTVVESYGYREYMAPMLEPLAMYAAKSGDEIANDQTYTFTDRGGREVAIRPEMTPSITRMVAAKRQELPLPARLYSIANFMRYERPQHGREREFWQLNFDLFGDTGVSGDIEIIHLAYDIVKYFGATSEMFTIKVNNRKLTNFIMCDYLQLNSGQAAAMIKLLDRYDKLPRSTFELCVRDIVGDNSQLLDKIDKIIQTNELSDLPAVVIDSAPAKELATLIDALHTLGVDNARYDVRLMRGFDYYTGTVFEVFDENPTNKRAMFGGGRYDGLVAMFGVEALPVVGAAPGETMFVEFLRAHSLIPDLSDGIDIYLIPIGHANYMPAEVAAKELRAKGIIVAVDNTQRRLDKQIKAGVKHRARYLAFIGDEETKSKTIQLKHSATGEQLNLTIDEIAQKLTQ